jgi:hypothetical protein
MGEIATRKNNLNGVRVQLGHVLHLFSHIIYISQCFNILCNVPYYNFMKLVQILFHGQNIIPTLKTFWKKIIQFWQKMYLG